MIMERVPALMPCSTINAGTGVWDVLIACFAMRF